MIENNHKHIQKIIIINNNNKKNQQQRIGYESKNKAENDENNLIILFQKQN